MRYLCTHLPSPVVSVLFILSSLTQHLALSLNTTQVQLMKEISNHSFYWKWNGSSYARDPYPWNSSSDPCQWHGVICSENGVDVVELDMSDTGSEYDIEFTKSIFQIICKLPAIQRLNLSHQCLGGELPQELNECTRLNLIDLSYNYISSLGGLGSLANLKTLLLSSNDFSGNIPVNIYVELLNMTGLKTLVLSYNDFYGSIPVELLNMTCLESLDLSNNHLSGLGGLGSLANLKTLLLSSNYFSGSIPVELLYMTGLETLDLSHNYLSDLGGLGSLANLKTLFLSSNDFSGSIPVDLLYMTGLETLDLSHNQLNGPIPPQLFSLSNLTDLDLTSNLLSGGIPQNFSRNLFALRIGYNKLNGTIPSTVSNAPNLTYLEMNHNFLDGPIPKQLASCTQLKWLDLGYNELGGPLTHVLPKLLQLQYLNLTNNMLEGSIMDELSNLSNLTHVDLSANLLSGNISSKIFNLKQLNTLCLQKNHLTGIIPLNIQNGKSLLELRLNRNKLTGRIPSGIGKLHMLQIDLDLSHNSLRGKIPITLWNLRSLASLDFSNNRLTGKIPEPLANMTVLHKLDLSNNKLTGKIPKSFGEMRVSELTLSANRLTGEIPESMMAPLLDLSNNKLTGKIPKYVGKMQGSEINLSSNSLRGEIPESMMAVYVLDLSNNKLTGKIPESLGNISLSVLNLANNKLTGQIPESLGGLSVLNLSSNKLTGTIPESLKQISNLDLSNNELIYSIPMGRSHSTSLIKMLGAVGAVAVFITCCLLLGVLWISKLHNRTGFKQEISKILQKVEHPRISYEELLAATNRFHNSNLLATNSFGSVYKGFLTDGTRVAVKVLNLMHEQSDKIFRGECRVLQKVRHRNLARIITTCSTPHFKALIFEYFTNGSLEKYLYQDRCRLGLRKVLNIAIDIAHAVEYLHYDCYMHIVHCDIKPSNVLLDESMTAHLSDFGISRLMGKIAVNSVTSTIDLKGSVGYIAPEYGLSGMMSPRGDVYSYGILLLEMLTRKSPTDSMFDGGLNLHNWVNRAFRDRAFEVVDKSLLMDGAGKETEECLISLMRLGLLCSKDSPEARPTMRDVSNLLKNIQQDFSTDTSSSIKLRPTISNLVCDRGEIINCEEASDTQSSTF